MNGNQRSRCVHHPRFYYLNPLLPTTSTAENRFIKFIDWVGSRDNRYYRAVIP
jgi:hypothetical protein